MSKFIIYKADPNKWKPALLNAIDRDQYPAFLGGELRDPDGNPRYVTKVSKRKFKKKSIRISINIMSRSKIILSYSSRQNNDSFCLYNYGK